MQLQFFEGSLAMGHTWTATTTASGASRTSAVDRCCIAPSYEPADLAPVGSAPASFDRFQFVAEPTLTLVRVHDGPVVPG